MFYATQRKITVIAAPSGERVVKIIIITSYLGTARTGGLVLQQMFPFYARQQELL